MKVLLVTSEELHPGNVYASCFELAQAKALKSIGLETAIISWRQELPVSFCIKKMLLHIAGSKDGILAQ